jgi:hypothetical protein
MASPQAVAAAAQTAPAPQPPPAAGPLKSNPATKYQPGILKQQKLEGWILSAALLIAVGLTFVLWRFSSPWWCCAVLAVLGGFIGGLLHSLKWFYRTIGNGEWEYDRLWWRFMNPLVSGVMGFSIYIVFRSGVAPNVATNSGLPAKESLYAYSIGFLTGLFADNAMSKLRDIAYVVFGTTAESKAKPPAQSKAKPATEGAHPAGPGGDSSSHG